MPGDPSFERLMQEVRAGSPRAIEELVSAYTPHVLRVVRRWLHRELRNKFDSIDFAQSVWASFFARERAPDDFPDAKALVAFLTVAATSKTVDEVRRRLRTGRYRAGVDESLDAMCERAESDPDKDEPDELPQSKEATPSQIVVGKEAWAAIQETTTPDDFRVVELRALGMKFEDIAARLGIDEGTARRIIRRLKRRLQGRGHG